MSRPPLAGVRVLDFTQLLPGAVCTMYLADLGAQVTKIEPPGSGEAARGPAGTPPGGIFHITNRNKRSLALDLKQADAVAAVRKLIAQADVIVEGFRPGVMARFGLSYDDARAINPAIVYCSITGYGQTGPLAHKAGHDLNYQSYAGIMGQNVTDGSRPSPGNFPIADLAGGGLSSAVGILAALLDARQTGTGRHIDISMTDCAMALNLAPLSSLQMFGNREPMPGRDILSGGLPCYRTYETADGKYLAVGALEPKFWHAFCTAIERPDLVKRGWDMGPGLDGAVAEIAAVIAQKTLAEWVEIFAPVDACVAPVLSLGESLAGENAKARDMVITVDGGGAKTTQFANPIRMTDFAFAVTAPPPLVGEHNDEILGTLD